MCPPAIGTASRSDGFSLIELLITLVIIGIIAAIVIAAVLGAHEKAKQGATMADMRGIGTAIESYAIDHGDPPGTLADFSVMETILEPYHTSAVPINDHWGNIYHYTSNPEGYTLVSYGRDGAEGDDLTPSTRFEYERDIVFSNGRFPGGF